MKTSLTLAILGAYNMLMGAMMLAAPGAMAMQMIGETRASASPDLLEMATMFHYGLSCPFDDWTHLLHDSVL